MAIDYNALISAIVSQIGPAAEVETPQLGRVTFHNPADALAAVRVLQMMQAEASGVPLPPPVTAGVFVATYDRGLGDCPTNGGSQ